MTRVELLSAINAYAQKLDLKPVSDRRIDDWREKNLLSEPRRRGRGRGRGVDRDWGEDALEAARQILRLETMGERRASQHLAYLWLMGGHQSAAEAREAIASEFERTQKRIRRRLPDPTASDTPFAQTALRRRVGSVDPALGQFVPKGPDGRPITETVALAGLPSLFGFEGKPIEQLLFEELPELAELELDTAAQAFLSGFTGLVGEEDETETSALQIVSNSTDAEFEIARAKFQMFWFSLGFAISNFAAQEGSEELASLDGAQWAITYFVQHLNGLQESNSNSEFRG